MAQGSFWGIDDPVQRLRGGLDEIRCHAHTSGSPRRLIFFLFTFFYQQQCFFPKGLIVLLFCTETHTKSYCVFNKRVETFCNKLSVARLSLSIPPPGEKKRKKKKKKAPRVSVFFATIKCRRLLRHPRRPCATPPPATAAESRVYT